MVKQMCLTLETELGVFVYRSKMNGGHHFCNEWWLLSTHLTHVLERRAPRLREHEIRVDRGHKGRHHLEQHGRNVARALERAADAHMGENSVGRKQ